MLDYETAVTCEMDVPSAVSLPPSSLDSSAGIKISTRLLFLSFQILNWFQETGRRSITLELIFCGSETVRGSLRVLMWSISGGLETRLV